MSRSPLAFLRHPPAGGDGRWYRVSNTAGEDEQPAEILIYDVIGSWFGVDAAELVRELKAITASRITVRIHSPGGSVSEGIAILNALRAHPARVTTVVDGLAASAASFVAMAGDEIVMRRNAEMMIHEAWGVEVGTAEDLRAYAARLDQASANIASIYADRAGGTVQQWREAMRAETWYSDTEAVAAGLADRVEPAPADVGAGGNLAAFDLSVFNYAGRSRAPAPPARAGNRTTTTAPPGGASRKESPVDTLVETLRAKLGLGEGADGDAVVAAVDALVGREAAPTLADVVAHAKEQGLVLVDAAQHRDLLAAAEELTAMRAQQLKEDHERLVDAAVGDGRIPPARRAHFLALLGADPEGAATLLATLPKGLVPVDGEHGHARTPTEADENALYESLFGKDN